MIPLTITAIMLATFVAPIMATHHMKRAPVQYVARQSESTKPLVIQNLCSETIHPAILTQAGDGPSSTGFELAAGAMRNMTVGADWQGRVWGRTNCSFNSDGSGPANAGGVNGAGTACVTGDCNGLLQCQIAGLTPVSLAEFTLASSSGQTFYDISLVDGYNIPIAIVSLYPESGNSSLQEIPPNLTNPICIGSTSSSPTASNSISSSSSGTNATFPIPLSQSIAPSDLGSWCPWDLQLTIPTGPADGVYMYPDSGSIPRPAFNPCYSACAKYQHPQDCCTGAYASPSTCTPSTYSQDAKRVCPDAYSYAFDDQTSTFIIPSGGGFMVEFCPSGGKSSDILSVFGKELVVLAQGGTVDPKSTEGGGGGA